MTIFSPIKSVFVLCGLVIAFSSCRRAEEATPDATDSVENSNQILVTFPKTSLAIGITDSVVAVFFDGGSRTVTRRASRGGSFYTIPLSGLATGNWKANIKVYTAAATSKDVAKMYRLESTINSATSSSLVGPTGKLTDTWKPNLLFRSADFGIKLAIAELPTDSYYELSLPQNLISYESVYIDRYVYRTVDTIDYVVAYGNSIFKAADYKGTTINTTTFAPMAAAMAGQTWNSADISLQLFNSSGSSYREVFKQTITNK
jgi:hypothetical protein